jgi:hypothetical protein
MVYPMKKRARAKKCEIVIVIVMPLVIIAALWWEGSGSRLSTWVEAAYGPGWQGWWSYFLDIIHGRWR